MTAHIVAARARAEARLGSTCTITDAGTGPATIDPDTLAAIRPDRTPIHTGLPCSVGDPISDRDRDRAGIQLNGIAYPVAVPVDATGIHRGHQLTITAVDAAGDPALVGVTLTIDQAPIKSRAVLRRLICVDTRPTTGRLP